MTENSSSSASMRSGQAGSDTSSRRRIPTPPLMLNGSRPEIHSPMRMSAAGISPMMQPGNIPSIQDLHLSPRSAISGQPQGYPTVETMRDARMTTDSQNSAADMPAPASDLGAGERPLFDDWTTIEPPLVVNKPSLQNVVFKQPVSIRYLRPPTPPPPGPIVIRERRPAPPPPLPPRVIRQQLPKIRTPEPLVIRERPPTPPRPMKPVIIEKHLPAPPPPPQQVIIERYNMPRRPRKVVFEKWLDYKPGKRRIILQKAPNLPPRPPPRNIIIEYSSPVAVSLPEYKIEGVFVADPLTYTYSPYEGELKVVDKIYDLPPPPVRPPGMMTTGNIRPPPSGMMTTGNIRPPPSGMMTTGNIRPPPVGMMTLGNIRPPPPGMTTLRNIRPSPPGMKPA